MQVVLLLVLIVLASAGVRAAEPTTEELDRFGIGVMASASGSWWGFPMAGPGMGLAARLRIVEGLSLEPHVDGRSEAFVLVGVLSAQAAVPVVFEWTTDGIVRPHVGLGPWVATAMGYGHDSADLGTFVGGEVLGGVGVPLNDFVEARAQLRAHVAHGVARGPWRSPSARRGPRG